MKLRPDPTFKATVNLTRPGGAVEVAEFVFRRKGRKALAEWLGRLSGDDDPGLIAEILEDWNLAGDDGEPVPYEPSRLAELLDSHHMAGAEIVRGYVEAVTASHVK